MKLKVTRGYTDKELQKNMIVGQEFETSNERAKILIDKDFCIKVDEPIDGGSSIESFDKPKQRRNRTKK